MRHLDLELSQVTWKLDFSTCTILVVPYWLLDLRSTSSEEQRLENHILACRHHDHGISLLCSFSKSNVDGLGILVDLDCHVICCEIVYHRIGSL